MKRRLGFARRGLNRINIIMALINAAINDIATICRQHKQAAPRRR